MSFVILGNGGRLESTVKYTEAINNFFSKKGFEKGDFSAENVDIKDFLNVLRAYDDGSDFFKGKIKSLENLGDSFSEERVNIHLSRDIYNLSDDNEYQAILYTAKAFSDGKGHRSQPIEPSTLGFYSLVDLNLPDRSKRNQFYNEFKDTIEGKFYNHESSESSIQIF